MTLEEAIKHAEEVAKDRNETANLTPTEYGDYINSCRECAEEHEQLAEWLKDYKRLLEEQPQGEWGETELLIDEDKCKEFRYVKGYYHKGCPNIGKYLRTTYSFCPDCGAKMKNGGTEE